MYYPEELIEEIRVQNDIIDVIGSHVQLTKKKAVGILGYVHFIMKRHHLFFL